MGGEDETGIEAGVGFGVEVFVHLAQAGDIGDLEIVFAMLEFFLVPDFAIGDVFAPGFIPDGGGVVEGDQDAFETVGDFDRNGIEGYATNLLKISELGDFLPVHPDFPAQPPSGDGRLRPVIFDKSNVVLARVDADGFERVEVELLRVAGIGFQDNLKLGVLLEAIWVLAVAPIIGADGGLDIGNAPRLWSEDAQEGGGVHCPRANLGVVGLGDGAAVCCPELLELEDYGLEAFWLLGHR